MYVGVLVAFSGGLSEQEKNVIRMIVLNNLEQILDLSYEIFTFVISPF